MNKIFNFFKKDNNDQLSKLNSYDLDILSDYLNEYLIDYRDNLNLSSNITFGTEIELAFANVYDIKRKVDLNKSLTYEWDTSHETSIERGAEVVSPIMEDKINFWKELKKVCKIIEKLGTINTETSSHVHVGSQILGTNKQNWLNFIKLWSAYENIIYRFTNGEFINTRIAAYDYAFPIRKELKEIYEKYKCNSKTLYNMLCKLSKERNQAVNFMNINKKSINTIKDKNTIEFRTPNGTTDYVIIQNNINFLVKLLLYSKNTDYNNDIIEKRIRNLETNIDSYFYENVCLDQALELVDLIFDNNLDKINFLKQYLKNYEETNRIDCKCKKITSR